MNDKSNKSDNNGTYDLLAQMGYFNNPGMNNIDDDDQKELSSKEEIIEDAEASSLKENKKSEETTPLNTQDIDTEDIPLSKDNIEKEIIEEESNTLFEATSSNEENISVVEDDTEVFYDLPEDFFNSGSSNDDDHVYGDDDVVVMRNVGGEDEISPEQKIPGNAISGENIPKNNTSSILKNTKKRSYSEEDESEKKSFSSDIKTDSSNSANTFLNQKRYADEEDESVKIEIDEVEEEEHEEEEKVDISQLEGRKAPSSKAVPGGKKRRQSERKAELDKKVYNIEQDLSDIDGEDMDYDGYYEDVLPIDFGQNKKKIDVKRLFTLIGAVIVFVVFMYFMIKIVFSGW